MYTRNSVPHPVAYGEQYLKMPGHGLRPVKPLDMPSQFKLKPSLSNHHQLYRMNNHNKVNSIANSSNNSGSNHAVMPQLNAANNNLSGMPRLNQIAQSQNDYARQGGAPGRQPNISYRNLSNEVDMKQNSRFELHRQAFQNNRTSVMPPRKVLPIIKHGRSQVANPAIDVHDTRPVHHSKASNNKICGFKSRCGQKTNKLSPRRTKTGGKRYGSEMATDADNYAIKPKSMSKPQVSSPYKRQKRSESYSDSDTVSTSANFSPEVYDMNRLETRSPSDISSQQKQLNLRLKGTKFCSKSSNEAIGFIIPTLPSTL